MIPWHGSGMSSFTIRCNSGRLKRHSGVHMMFDMVIHLPVEEGENRIERDRARIDAIIGRVVGQADVLRHVQEILEAARVKLREGHQHRQHPPPSQRGD